LSSSDAGNFGEHFLRVPRYQYHTKTNAMEDITKKYTNGEITVVWKPKLCIHSAICFKGLPAVFDPRRRPWIKPEAAGTDVIMEQVRQCPSGALSYFTNEKEGHETMEIQAETKVEAIPNGPLLVYGNVLITDSKGQAFKKNKVTAFCRCGQSGNKPFCDGSHVKADFRD
jgi:uncharacterized Fe-S cluster protein YjdI